MFTKKNILILIGRNALVALSVIIITVIVIIFLSNGIKRVSETVALNYNLKMQLEKRTGLFEVLKKDTQIVGTNNILIENAFASSDNILEFISILDSLATKNALTQVYSFASPIPSEISGPFPISTILYSNSFGANVLAFSNYLKEFDKLPYFTKIDGFNIGTQDKLGWLEVSTVSLRATLYTKNTQ